jgi:hypothetical protein
MCAGSLTFMCTESLTFMCIGSLTCMRFKTRMRLHSYHSHTHRIVQLSLTHSLYSSISVLTYSPSRSPQSLPHIHSLAQTLLINSEAICRREIRFTLQLPLPTGTIPISSG